MTSLAIWLYNNPLTHRVTHICVNQLDHHWEHLESNFSEIVITIVIFLFEKMRLKRSSVQWWKFCLGLSVVKHITSIFLWVTWNTYINNVYRNVDYIQRSTHTVCDVLCLHDDVITWKHFPRHWPFVQGIHRSSVNFPHKGQWRGALMSSLIYAWINGWVNNREAGNFRRHRARYDVTVMIMIITMIMELLIYMSWRHHAQ